MEHLFPFILGGIIALVHLIGEDLEGYIKGRRQEIVSFSSGASITYIFLQLIPELHRIASESSSTIFLFPLLGFSSIHLAEKYVAKGNLDEKEMKRDYAEIHSTFLFLYHGAVGYLVASLLMESAAQGLLFFLPIVLHVAVSSLSVTELHESFVRKNVVKYAVTAAPLIGVLLHNQRAIAEQYFNSIFGTVIGMFFYVVIRDSIPREDKGRPLEYLLGMIIYILIIFWAGTI